MPPPAKLNRARWWPMLAVWGLCAGLIFFHTQAVNSYVATVDALGLRGAAEAPTPQRHIVPTRFADTQMWVRHALTAQAAGEARVRFTTADNAPHGRAVHWASPLQWIMRATGIEHSLRWLNAVLLLAGLVLLSGWTAARAGAAAGALVALGMIGHNRFYEGFAPYNVDHHGLLAAAVLGLVLGAVFMGAGWWKPQAGLLPADAAAARRAATISAVCGGLGLWLSAASVLPAIALLGIAGLASAWIAGAGAVRDGVRFAPDVWRRWGRVGALTSLVCYLIEYAPAHLGWRLEANHPLYALAWWGGAEIVAALAGWRTGAGRPAAGKLLPPALALSAAPLAVILGGDAVFSLRDPFIGELRHFVFEGLSLPAAAARFGFGAIAYHAASAGVVLAAAALLWRSRGAEKISLALTASVAVAWIALGVWETRWWAIGSGPQIALLLAALASLRLRPAWIVAVAALLFLPAAIARIAGVHASQRAGVVDELDILQPLYRDIAAALRDTEPRGDIVLLASPNASAGIGYHGRFQTIGTLYWENTAGLRAAAEIFCARTEGEAAALVRARGITHVAMVSTASFLGEFFQLLHPGLPAEEAKARFGHRLFEKDPGTPWLQPIPYRRPPDLAVVPATVALFRVAFDQTEPERLFHTAAARAADGDPAAAESLLEAALARTPAREHLTLLSAAGHAFYDYGADAAAMRTLRRALALENRPDLATTAAWILATTADAALRNGRAALALIEPIAARAPADPTVLSALAAACAETGRFTDAVQAAERALTAGDAAARPLLERRLASYRASQPWRQ